MTAAQPVHFYKDRGEARGDEMEPYLQEKLASEVERYQNKDFLKAAMAAFVLTAHADGSMGSVERYNIDETLRTEPGLREFDFQKATEMQVFRQLCELLRLEPTEVWRKSWN